MAGIHGDDESADFPQGSGEFRAHEPPDLATIGDRVAWLRNIYELSLQGFGRRIGYDGSQISRIERNRCHVVDRFVKVVCMQFRVKEAWLRWGNGPAFLEGTPAARPEVLPPATATPTGPTASSGERKAAPPLTPLPGGVLPDQQTWDEAWQDLRSYVEVLDRLSPRSRAGLAARLHELVNRVCVLNLPEDDYPTSGIRVREGEDEFDIEFPAEDEPGNAAPSSDEAP